MRGTGAFAFACLLCSALAASAWAQPAPADGIRSVMDALLDAARNQDAARVADRVHESFVFRTADGGVGGRQAFLDQLGGRAAPPGTRWGAYEPWVSGGIAYCAIPLEGIEGPLTRAGMRPTVAAVLMDEGEGWRLVSADLIVEIADAAIVPEAQRQRFEASRKALDEFLARVAEDGKQGDAARFVDDLCADDGVMLLQLPTGGPPRAMRIRDLRPMLAQAPPATLAPLEGEEGVLVKGLGNAFFAMPMRRDMPGMGSDDVRLIGYAGYAPAEGTWRLLLVATVTAPPAAAP